MRREEEEALWAHLMTSPPKYNLVRFEEVNGCYGGRCSICERWIQADESVILIHVVSRDTGNQMIFLACHDRTACEFTLAVRT